MLCIAGTIHLLPFVGVIGSSQLYSLYGFTIKEPNLLILMRHRAVLFGVFGSYLIKSAFDTKSNQNYAIISGLIAAGSFIMIAYDVKGYNSKLNKVVLADYIACGCLFVAGVSRNL